MDREIIKKLKNLGAFWENDESNPSLFEREVLEEYIENLNSLSGSELLKVRDELAILLNQKNIRKESETCSRLINPMLKLLGFGDSEACLFDEQRNYSQDGLSYIPDYCLFSEKSYQEAANSVEDNDYYKEVGLILEAKRRGVDPYRKNKVTRQLDDVAQDSASGVSPLSQLRRYLRVTKTDYGIVSNGEDWVLASKNSDNHNSVYHINLRSLVDLSFAVDEPGLVLYWLIPFGSKFLGAGLGRPIEEALRKTETKKNMLEENLKDRLEPVLLDLLNNYYCSLRKKEVIKAKKEAAVGEALNFVYLLFYIACLEDRNLLPISNPIYHHYYSLKKLFQVLQEGNTVNLRDGKTFYIFNHLSRLSTLVSNGCKGLAAKGTVKAQHTSEPLFKVSNKFRFKDKVFSKLVLELFKSPSNPGRMADFRLLDTIQFGNIYEHLLRLDIQFDEKKKQFTLKESSKKNERTTAVFTPHHIVKDMVHESLSDVCFGSWEEVGCFKAIDPCFGSGHFLIELSRQMATLVLDQLDEEDIPLFSKSESITFGQKLCRLQRFFFTNVLYGVDRGENCVDVAKFAIWLATISRGESPLPLDENLKVGNSLYGSCDLSVLKEDKKEYKRVKDKSQLRKRYKRLLSKKGMKGCKGNQIVDSYKKIDLSKNKKLSNHYLGINSFQKKSEVIKQQKPFFWINEFPEVFLGNQGFNLLITNPPYDQIRPSPNTLAYNAAEHSSFRLSLMTDKDLDYYKILFETDSAYRDFQEGNKNLFEGFILLKDKILKNDGSFSFIVPNKILASEQTSKIRKNLWKNSLKLIKEYPEKDASSRRVFKSKKVACAILHGNMTDYCGGDVKVEVYNDANLPSPDHTGKINLAASEALNPAFLPIVLQTDLQKNIIVGLNKFSLNRLNKKHIKDGELDESFNKDSLVSDGGSPIYSTNRMQPFGFTLWTKQERIKYCDITKASKISEAKLKDARGFRVGINGIAGSNDTRVLNAALLPPNTIINNNVNYVSLPELGKVSSPFYYLAFMNSFLFDQLIRIEKKTNHNSGAMIANLPIPTPAEGEIKSLLNKNILSASDMYFSNKDVMKIQPGFKQWLEQTTLLNIECLNKVNLTSLDLLNEFDCVADVGLAEQQTICRRLFSGNLNPTDLIGEIGLSGKKGSNFKNNLNEIIERMNELREIIKSLEFSLNYHLFSLVGFKEVEIKKAFEAYNVNFAYSKTKISSLKSIKSNLAVIETEEKDSDGLVDFESLVA